MKIWVLTAWTSFAVACAIGCGSDDDVGTGVVDAGEPEPDVGTVDAGRPRGLCPEFANPSCSDQQTCVEQSDFNNGQFQEVSTSCTFCRPLSASVCTFGSCELREEFERDLQLVPSGGAQLTVNLGNVEARTTSLVAIALQAETAGGQMLSCDDFRGGDTALLDDGCTNIVEVRIRDGVDGDSQTFSLSRFGGDRDIVYLVYAFEQPEAKGDPIGVYCTRQFTPVDTQGGVFDVPPEADFEVMQELN